MSDTLPPFPELASAMDNLPNRTDPVIVATSTDRLFLFANSDNSGKNAWVPDIPNQPGLKPFEPTMLSYWDKKPPLDYTLTMRRFWRLVPNTFTHVQPGGGFKKSYTVTHGISTTDSQTISAEMGCEADGLSAKISASFSHSVTVSDEKVEQTEFSAGPPDDGFVRVWALWQLIDEIVALDPAGNVIPHTEPELNRKGEIMWWSTNIMPFGEYDSGAFLSYPKAQMEFPSTTFMPQQKDFAA